MNSIIPWVGGKNYLKKTIANYIPKDIMTYVEPFGGAGWVLLYKDKWAETEVYNDLDERLVNMFRTIKNYPEELAKELGDYPIDKDTFHYFLAYSGETDIEKAARFIYVQSLSFGAKAETYIPFHNGSKDFQNKCRQLISLSKRLSDVIIENESYEVIIDKYDNENTFFYCDPPYSKGVKYNVARDFNHQLLKKILDKINCRFLLSYNDNSEIRELYKDYDIVTFERHNNMIKINKTDKRSPYKELLIGNYDLEAIKNISNQIEIDF